MSLLKHVWEGWLVQDFIDALEPTFNMIIMEILGAFRSRPKQI